VKDFVAGFGGGAILPPSAPVPADGDDCGAPALEDRAMASPCVKSAIAGHGADLFVNRDLLQQMGQNGAVAPVARGEFHGTDVAGGRVHRQMNLAILASALRAVLARKPLPIPEELDPVLSTSRFSGPDARRFDIGTVIRFCRRLTIEKSGTGQSRPAIDRMLATIPVVWRSGSPNRTFTIKQNWTAASLNTGGRPLAPTFGANHVMSLSNQISREPRRFRASL